MRKLAHICRHPIKGHGRESLQSVTLTAGECLPWDRHWAIAHEAAKLIEGWNSCNNFTRGAKSPRLMAITCNFDEVSRTISLHHPDQDSITLCPDDPEDAARLIEWVRPLNAEGRALPTQIVTAGRGMTDSRFPSVAILSVSSLQDLSQRMGQDLSIDRWRGNLWLQGAQPWAEWDWVGRTIVIGGAVLRIKERITRCVATMVDPETGRSNAATLGALESHFGHKDFGLYAEVEQGGDIALGQDWNLQ